MFRASVFWSLLLLGLAAISVELVSPNICSLNNLLADESFDNKTSDNKTADNDTANDTANDTQTETSEPSTEDSTSPEADPFETLIKAIRGLEDEARRDAAREAWEIQDPSPGLIAALAKSVHDRDRQASANAMEALSRMGPKASDAIESLIKKLQDRDDQQRYRASYALGSIGSPALEPVQKLLAEKESTRQTTAALQAIGFMKTLAKPAIPNLMEALHGESEEVASYAAEALLQVGNSAVATIMESVTHEKPEIRRRALGVLANIQPATPKLIELAERLLSDESIEVRVQAVSAYAKLAGDNPATAIRLVEEISSDNLELRRIATHSVARMRDSRLIGLDAFRELVRKGGDDVAIGAFAIAQLGPSGIVAVDDVLNALESEPDHQAALAGAAAAMGPEVIKHILERMSNGETKSDSAQPIVERMGRMAKTGLLQDVQAGSEHRAAAATLMGFVRPVDDEIVGVLRQFLKDGSTPLQMAAASGLAKMGKDAKAAIEDLRPLLSTEDHNLQAIATKALFELGADPSTFIEALLGGLKSDDVAIRREVANAVSQLSELSSSQTDLMLRQITDDDAEVRRDIVTALGKADKTRDDVRDALVEMLKDSDEPIRIAAITALGTFGEQLGDTVNELMSFLDSDSEAIRSATFDALRQLGTSAARANERLTKLSSTSSDATSRVMAMTTLAKTMNDKREFVGILQDRLSDDDWNVRKRSFELLGEAGKDAADAVPALLLRLDVESDSEFARNALRSIDAAPPEAVPILIKILEDNPSRRTRYYALHLLRKSGENAKAAIPVLNRLIESGSLDSRSESFVKSIIDEINKPAEQDSSTEKKD